MDWKKWWNKKKDQNNSQRNGPQQEHEEAQPAIETKTVFKSYSSSRSCKSDPENSNYLICTEKVHDGNNTYENQERVPVNQNNSFSTGLFDFNSPFFKNNPFAHEQVVNRIEFQDFDKAMQNFMTPFFHLPSFFGHNNFEAFDQNMNNFSHPHSQEGQNQRYNHNSQPRGRGDYTPGVNNYDGQQNRQDRYQGSGRNDHKHYFSNKQRDYDIKDI